MDVSNRNKGLKRVEKSFNPFSFLESRPLWKKALIVLVCLLPILAAGLIFNLSSFFFLGSSMLVLAAGFISLCVFYTRRHEGVNKNHEENTETLSSDLTEIKEEVNVMPKEISPYHMLIEEEKKHYACENFKLKEEKKQFIASLDDFKKRNEVLTEIKKSLTGANGALHSVSNEKSRIISQQSEVIKQLKSVLNDYISIRTKLEAAINELVQAKTGMLEEVDKMKNAQGILIRFIADFSKLVTRDNSRDFLARLNELVENKEVVSTQIVDEALIANHHLILMSKKFEASILVSQQLLARDEENLQRYLTSEGFFYGQKIPEALSQEPDISIKLSL